MYQSKLTEVCALFAKEKQHILHNWMGEAGIEANIRNPRELDLFRGLFSDLLDSFVENLSSRDYDAYYASNERLALRAAGSSLSFRKLIMAFHAFEDAYIDLLCNFSQTDMVELLRELDHIHHTTIAILSEEYFAIHDWKIMALAKLCEIRDTETSAHLERTRDYCALLADALGQDDIFVEQITWASPLHDLGKIQVPDSILHKKGRLTDEELALMRQHPTAGAQILDDLLKGQKISAEIHRMMHDIVLYHHEKFDGSGYPAGLKGKMIPLAARIAALADAYDAITSKRPYKEPLPHSEAVGRIVAESGRHFDPEVVQAFLRVQDQFERLGSLGMNETA